MECDTTICVLTYNAIDVTKKFLELLYKNTENFKLILIDNGSSDGTPQYLNDILPNLYGANATQHAQNIILNQENHGVIGGRNMGFAIFATEPTKYLCFLDNDQFVQNGWLEQHINYMRDNNLDIVGADAWLLNKKFMPTYHSTKKGDPYSYVGCGGMLMKKEVVENVGSFDAQFNPAYFEDPDYNFRAMQKQYKIGWNAHAKIVHMPHQTLGQNSQRGKIFRESYEKFCVKWQDYNPIVMR